ncbi:hypothetical protein C0993_011758 [Termitomyces sp. T159_Od127]|nr:hypothetical protein C0993_011758 [Termitomyces sp. T159_Od127]
MKIVNCFHANLLSPHVPNDDTLFPSRTLEMPGPIVTEDGQEEHFIDCIIDERRRGRGLQYLVRWRGYGPDHDEWKSGKEMDDTMALDEWEAKKASKGLT